MPQRFMIFGMPLSVLALILVNALIEFALMASDAGLLGIPHLRATAYRYGAFWLTLLHGGPPMFPAQPATMFLTYAFLHGGLIHMAVNMLALFSFGTVIVRRLGQKRFLIAYLLCAIGGGVGFALLSPSPVPMVGASGALFGLLGIWLCWDYLDRRRYGDPLWVTGRALLFLVLYNLVFWVLLSGNLAWETHLGGFVTGWILAVFWSNNILAQSRRRRFGSERSGRWS
ncbi:MAG: rhomboid family intramembrane serine protease [Rhodobacteraceae bacterium]|nr:rhomboid family intramembrane serine protease [Paracoccaceae bacterium]